MTERRSKNNMASSKSQSITLTPSSTISPSMKTSTPLSGNKHQVSTTNNNGNNNFSSGNQIPSDILDDLACRFIINVPADERNNLIRICFQIELAHWFYLDFYGDKLMPCGFKQFALQLFQHIPFLRAHLSNGIDKILDEWKQYKLSVPTYGAILISEDFKKALLVQSYCVKNSWGFPKGKVNENEDPVHCAAREVFEETGFDISNLIEQNDYIDAFTNYQYTRLYLVPGIPFETIFATRTRKEIKCIEWFPIEFLPAHKNDNVAKQNLGMNANSFFMILPFVKRLKQWIQAKQNGEIPTLVRSASFGKPLLVDDMVKKCPYRNLQYEFNSFTSNSSQQHNNGNNNNNNNSSTSKTESKRERHKSMSDIDGVKLKGFQLKTPNKRYNEHKKLEHKVELETLNDVTSKDLKTAIGNIEDEKKPLSPIFDSWINFKFSRNFLCNVFSDDKN